MTTIRKPITDAAPRRPDRPTHAHRGADYWRNIAGLAPARQHELRARRLPAGRPSSQPAAAASTRNDAGADGIREPSSH